MVGKPAIQGNADGLCGLYGLINFLVLKEEVVADGDKKDAKQEAFRYLMVAAERLGLLNAWRLVDGFEWSELVEIYNSYSSRQYGGFTAVPLSVLSKKVVGLKQEARLVFKRDGARFCYRPGGRRRRFGREWRALGSLP